MIRPEWSLIAFLWMAYVLNHADRQVVYTLLPSLQKEFAYSDQTLGLIGALFLWVYGLSSPIAGILGDRFSRVKLVVGSLIIWSTFTVLSGLAPNGTALLACRALLGVSESFFMPAAFALMANAHGPETRSRAIAIFASSQMVGVALGGSLSGWIAELFHWRAAFLALGAIGILFALPLWLFLRTVPPHFTAMDTANPASFRSFGALFKIPSIRVVMVFVGIATFGLFLVYTWLPTFLYDRFGIGLARAGFEASVYPQIGTALGLLTGGFLADKIYLRNKAARFWIILIAFLGCAPCMYLIGIGPTLGATRIAAMCFGFFAGFIAGNQAPSAFDVVPASQRATAVGVLNVAGAGVSGFAPYLGGLARRTIGIGNLMGYAAAMYLACSTLIFYAIVRYFDRDHEAARRS
ncbi:MFS transporter [Bryobacterales bacterium F-183]|nr:MFS transporter [Bryobacterales bacterium F-183]